MVGVGPKERVVELCAFTALSRVANLLYREARPMPGVEESAETGALLDGREVAKSVLGIVGVESPWWEINFQTG